jgi:hypothetical protein
MTNYPAVNEVSLSSRTGSIKRQGQENSLAFLKKIPLGLYDTTGLKLMMFLAFQGLRQPFNIPVSLA